MIFCPSFHAIHEICLLAGGEEWIAKCSFLIYIPFFNYDSSWVICLQEEEEWHDFKDDSDRDLTDLKISKLQIEDEEEGGGGSADDDGEAGDHKDKKDGVWKTEPIQAPPPAAVVVSDGWNGGDCWSESC